MCCDRGEECGGVGGFFFNKLAFHISVCLSLHLRSNLEHLMLWWVPVYAEAARRRKGTFKQVLLFINMFWSQAKGCECTWCTALRVVLFGRVCVERVSLLRSGLDTVSQPVWPLAPSLSRCRPSVQSPINAPPHEATESCLIEKK